MREPSVKEWILRGFVYTRITRHSMYRWYKEQTKQLELSHVNYLEFDIEFNSLLHDRFIQDVGDATCYEHDRHVREPSYEFTAAGEATEKAQSRRS